MALCGQSRNSYGKPPAGRQEDQYLTGDLCLSVCLHGWLENQSPDQRHPRDSYTKSKGLRDKNI